MSHLNMRGKKKIVYYSSKNREVKTKPMSVGVMKD
jgi:hypothetical protein